MPPEERWWYRAAFRILAFANHGPETLQRAIRGHGNLTEHAPIMLIVMFLAEYQGMPAIMLHVIGGTFLSQD